MKITAPANLLQDLDLDADEYYFGHVSYKWLKKYGIIASPNRRYFIESQLPAVSSYADFVKKAKKNKKKLFMTYNAPYYNDDQKKLILKEIKKFSKLGVDGFIVSDFLLIRDIKMISSAAEVHISTVANTFNHETATFYFNNGADRIVLPRQLTFDEIRNIVRKAPGKYEVFMLYDMCRNIDGFCTFQHGIEDSLGCTHGCVYVNKFRLNDKQAMPSVRRVINKRFENLDFPMFCAACRIKDFEKIGVHSVKIVGRRFDYEIKQKGISFVRSVIEGADPKKSYSDHYIRKCPHNCNYYGGLG